MFRQFFAGKIQQLGADALPAGGFGHKQVADAAGFMTDANHGIRLPTLLTSVSDDTDRLGKLPNAQLVLSKGYDLLLCTEDVDEFCLQMMHDYKEKEFKNINSGDLGLETEEEKKAAEETATENKDLFEEIKKALNGKVKEVKVNPTLQEHPVTLSAEGGISMEMEKVLRRMPNAEGVESTKVLELNPNHTVFAALKAAHAAGDTDKVAKYAELLYDQALLIAGLPIEDPVAYAQLVCGLMQ